MRAVCTDRPGRAAVPAARACRGGAPLAGPFAGFVRAFPGWAFPGWAFPAVARPGGAGRPPAVDLPGGGAAICAPKTTATGLLPASWHAPGMRAVPEG
jgi:hypothetical protein